jgi:plastocyanin
MMSRFALFVAALSIVVSSIAAAGEVRGLVSSGKSIPDAKKAAVVWIEGPAPAVVKPEKPVVSQTGVQFSPRVLTVVAGQTVSFPNEDDVAHNVFSLSQANKFKLGIYPKGETREVAFEKTGVIDLFCSIHRHMHAVIVVVPNDFHAEAKVGENYSIKNVPAGKHTIKVWNAAHKVVSQEITVPADGEIVVDLTLKD